MQMPELRPSRNSQSSLGTWGCGKGSRRGVEQSGVTIGFRAQGAGSGRRGHRLVTEADGGDAGVSDLTLKEVPPG